MTATTERLDAITARAADCQTYNFGLRNADQLAHNDVPYLLDLARKQAAAMEAVLSECAYLDTLAGGDKHYARGFRKIITKALEASL